MNLRFVFRAFWASMICSLKMVIRYVSLQGLVAFNLAVPVFFVLTSWTVSKIMAGVSGYLDFFTSATGGMSDYLSFVIIGFAFQSFIFSTMFGGGHAIRGEQEYGTAELIFVTPANKVAWLLGKMFGNLIFSFVSFSIVIAAGLFLFGFHPQTSPNVPTAMLAVLLTLLAMTALGLVFAGLCFLAKREEELTQVFWPMMTFFCGLAFPIEILPLWAQTIARMIPLTYGVDITRKAILLGNGVSDAAVLTGLGILFIQTAVLLPIGAILFAKLEKVAKRSGTLGTY